MQTRHRRWILSLAVVLTVTVPTLAHNVGPQAAAGGKFPDPTITFKKYTLPNGLEVILHQDKTVPLVAVDVWYHVGSGDEVPGKSGFAHLFEHMMFQGTKNTGEDQHFPILQQIGSSDSNGSTNENRTNYYEVVPSNQLEVALWLESDRMGYLPDAISEKSLANQRDVVRNERRQSFDNVPYGKDTVATAAALYPEGHPYRYSIIGLHEDIEGGSIDDVKGFFRTWYAPSNATLTLAGDFEIAAAEKLVEKWFGTFPKIQKPEHRTIETPRITETKRVTVEDPFARLRRVHYAWNTPAFYAPGDAELDILASALGQRGTGRLYKTLVIEKQLAQAVTVYQGSLQRSSTFNVIVDLRPNADMAEVERLIDAELGRVLTAPVTDVEFRRAVVAFESGSVWGLEDLMERAERLQAYNHFTGKPDWITEDLDRYRKTSQQAILDTAKKLLQKQNRVEVITMPAKAAPPAPDTPSPAAPAAATQAPPAPAPKGTAEPSSKSPEFPHEAFRATRPAAGPARALVPPAITHFTLPEGLDVYLVESHKLPTIAVDLTFDGGSENDPKGKSGQAALCMNLLDDGTAKLDKVAFEEAQADLGSTVGAYASVDQQGVTMRTLTKNLDRTAELWAESLKVPGLREADHARNVQQTLASLSQQKGAPATVAPRVFGSIYYGPDHPFGRVTTDATAKAVTAGDCKAYVNDYIKPGGAKLYLVGDITRQQVEQKLAPALKGWTGAPKASVDAGAIASMPGKLFFVDVPGAAQSMIYLFQAGPRRQADDYFPTRIMSDILGGDFASRINMNLREDKGWAYGAGGGMRYDVRTLGTFRAAAAVRTDATKDSVAELYKEVQKMSGGEVTDAELEREKNAAMLGLPAQFATGQEVLSSFRRLIYFGLPLDYWAGFARGIEAVNKESVAAAAKKYLKPAELQGLVVGDAAKVLPGLKELLASKSIGEGELVILDADGQPVQGAGGK
jgi:zinc protease